MAEERRRHQPNVANLVKRISLDLQSKSNPLVSGEVTFRKGTSDLRHKQAKALFSYSPDNDDELRLEANDVIEILGEEEEGWWRGRLKAKEPGAKDKEGVFPSNFVKLIESESEISTSNVTAEQDDKLKCSDSTESSQIHTQSHDIIQPKKIHGIGFGNIFAGENKIELRKAGGGPNGGGEPKKIDIVNKDKDAAPNKAALNGRKNVEQCQKNQEYAKVAFAYEAENEDELTLKEGDVILIVSKTCEDAGWWRGELNGKEGVFPDNFVDIMSPEEIEKQRKSMAPAPPVVPAKPVKLVGSIRPMSPETNHKHPPERPPPPEQHNRPQAQTPKTASPAGPAATPPSAESIKDKTPPENNAQIDKSNNTPKKFITSPLSLLMTQKQKTPNAEEKPTKVVDVERDAVAPLDSERLTHPTALRPRNPNKRPPSQAFLKDMTPNVGTPPFPDAVDGSIVSTASILPSTKASGDHKTDAGEFIRRDEYERLKSEFELFKKETQEKLRNLEKLFAGTPPKK